MAGDGTRRRRNDCTGWSAIDWVCKRKVKDSRLCGVAFSVPLADWQLARQYSLALAGLAMSPVLHRPYLHDMQCTSIAPATVAVRWRRPAWQAVHVRVFVRPPWQPTVRLPGPAVSPMSPTSCPSTLCKAQPCMQGRHRPRHACPQPFLVSR